jgi:DNA-binding protein HU-beta
MNKTELIQAVTELSGESKAATERVLNSFFKLVPEQLASNKDDEDYKIQIMGFGTYKTSFVAGRTGVNPQDRSQEVEIPDSHRVHFSAGQNFKDVVNGAVKAPAKKSSKKPAAKTAKAAAPAAKSKKKKKK